LLNSLRLTLFEACPGLHRLQAGFAGPRGQKAAVLEAARPELRW
jgi:hypothetical protein